MALNDVTQDPPAEANPAKSQEGNNQTNPVEVQEEKGKTFKCPLCGVLFCLLAKLDSHLRTHTGEKSHECLTCGKFFQTKKVLSKHIKVHMSKNKNVCNQCGKNFTKKENLTKHIAIHNLAPFSCDLCDKVYTQNWSLKRHRLSHFDDKPFKCEHCPVSCDTASHLKQHVRIHSGERPYKCSHCDKSFTQNSSLTKHLRVHSGDRPYVCPDCGKTYTENGHLKIHMRKHTGDKPFKCPTCNRCFYENGNLRQHMRIHSGEKPCTCFTCGKSFRHNGDLKEHLNVHTKDRPFQCDVCNKLFKAVRNLRRHKRTQHGDAKNQSMKNVKEAGRKVNKDQKKVRSDILIETNPLDTQEKMINIQNNNVDSTVYQTTMLDYNKQMASDVVPHLAQHTQSGIHTPQTHYHPFVSHSNMVYDHNNFPFIHTSHLVPDLDISAAQVPVSIVSHKVTDNNFQSHVSYFHQPTEANNVLIQDDHQGKSGYLLYEQINTSQNFDKIASSQRDHGSDLMFLSHEHSEGPQQLGHTPPNWQPSYVYETLNVLPIPTNSSNTSFAMNYQLPPQSYDIELKNCRGASNTEAVESMQSFQEPSCPLLVTLPCPTHSVTEPPTVESTSHTSSMIVGENPTETETHSSSTSEPLAHQKQLSKNHAQSLEVEGPPTIHDEYPPPNSNSSTSKVIQKNGVKILILGSKLSDGSERVTENNMTTAEFQEVLTKDPSVVYSEKKSTEVLIQSHLEFLNQPATPQPQLEEGTLDVVEEDEHSHDHFPEESSDIQIRITENSFFCSKCQQTFNNSIDFVSHMKVHNLEKVLTFPKKVSLKLAQGTEQLTPSVQESTLSSPSFSCDTCQKQFRSPQSFKDHQKTHNQIDDTSELSCLECGKSFAKRQYLWQHMKLHIAESRKSFKCPDCDKCFYDSGHLKSHVLIHTGIKPFECDICQRRFRMKGDLVRHMRTHTGEKPFICQECGKAFTIKESLKRHLRIHSGVHPYCCSVCDKTFAQKGNMIQHLRVHKPK